MNKTHALKSRAFTLIEVLIAISVLFTGLLATAGLFAYATATGHRAERQSLASFLVLAKLEELRTMAPAGLMPGGAVDPLNPLPDFSEYLITTGGPPILTLNAAEADLVRLWRIEGVGPTRIKVVVYAVPRVGKPADPPLSFGSTSRAGQL